MAFDKGRDSQGKKGGYKGREGGAPRSESGYKKGAPSGGYTKPAQGGYQKSAPSGYAKPAQGSDQRSAPSYQKSAPGNDQKPAQGYAKRDGQRPSYNRNDEAFSGMSTRPAKPGNRGEAFFGRGQTPAPQDRPRPMGGPRRAAPSTRPVPPSVRDEGPMPKREPSYPFKGQARPQPKPRPYGSTPRPNEQMPRPYGSTPRPYEPTPRPYEPMPRAPMQPIIAPQSADDVISHENMLVGRNPIREAIKAGRSIEKLLVSEGELSGSARQIVAWAREARVVVQYVDRSRLDQIYPNHQGMIAFASMAEYKSVEDILERAKELGEDPFIVVLDSITDPHNLGAIIRTAECAGAHGVIIPERRSAGLNPAAVKAAAGACEYQRIAKVVNLSRTLQELKERGLWIVGADMQGEPVNKVDLSGPIALVIGSEGEGIGDLILKQCDLRVALPIRGHIDSLNASVAAGVMMYQVMRARGGM